MVVKLFVCINLSDGMGVEVGPNFRQKCCTHCVVALQDAVPKSSTSWVVQEVISAVRGKAFPDFCMCYQVQ